MNMLARFSVALSVISALYLPLTAAAELSGTTLCTNPSWSTLASGQCNAGRYLGAHSLRSEGNDGAIELLAGEIILPGIPEPQTAALMLVGLLGLVAATRRRRR